MPARGFRAVWVGPAAARARGDDGDTPQCYAELHDIMLDALLGRARRVVDGALGRAFGRARASARVGAARRCVMASTGGGEDPVLLLAALTSAAHEGEHDEADALAWGCGAAPGAYVAFLNGECRDSWRCMRDDVPPASPAVAACMMRVICATARGDGGGGIAALLASGGAPRGVAHASAGFRVEVSVSSTDKAAPEAITAKGIESYRAGVLTAAIKASIDGCGAALGADLHFAQQTGGARYLWLGKLGVRKLPPKVTAVTSGSGGGGPPARTDDVSGGGGCGEGCGSDFDAFCAQLMRPWAPLTGDALRRAQLLRRVVDRRTDWAAQARYLTLSVMVLRLALDHVRDAVSVACAATCDACVCVYAYRAQSVSPRQAMRWRGPSSTPDT